MESKMFNLEGSSSKRPDRRFSSFSYTNNPPLFKFPVDLRNYADADTSNEI